MNYKEAKINLSSVYGKMVASTDFTVEELKQLTKENEKKEKEVKRKKVYPKRGSYNKSKTLEFFKDCLVIKIGMRESRKNENK